MATIKHFENLEIWKLSRELCNLIGKIIDDGSFKIILELLVKSKAHQLQ
jgi:hypothetical protein